MKAKLSNHRQSPRKIRPLARTLKGLSVPEALARLDLVAKKSAPDLKRLIASAAANAKNNFGLASDEELIIDNLQVDKGLALRRVKPAARGRAVLIHRTRSHLTVALKPKADQKPTQN